MSPVVTKAVMKAIARVDALSGFYRSNSSAAWTRSLLALLTDEHTLQVTLRPCQK